MTTKLYTHPESGATDKVKLIPAHQKLSLSCSCTICFVYIFCANNGSHIISSCQAACVAVSFYPGEHSQSGYVLFRSATGHTGTQVIYQGTEVPLGLGPTVCLAAITTAADRWHKIT